jgi:hypothetical protein
MNKICLFMLILLPGSVFALDTLFFDVTLLGVRAASVEISEKRLSGNVKEITYHAFTVGPFDKIYAIDNRYYYYSDTLLTRLDSLKKKIDQHDLKQEYYEYVSNDKIHYPGFLEQKITTPVHHVLSFLIHLQHYPESLETGTCFPFQITDEGDLYQAYIQVRENDKKQQKEVYFTFSKTGGRKILDPTDVFNWMICSGKGERMLAYCMNSNTITEGFFSLGWGLKLRAKRVYR